MTDWDGRPLRRREALKAGAGLALGAFGLAGCGVGDKSGDKKATQRVVKAKPDGDLFYFNYSEYVDPKLVKEFEKRYGVKVRESYYDSMQGLTAKLNAGARYDIIFPSAEYAARLRQGNQLLRIDRDLIPNAARVYPDLAKPWYDRKGEFTTPYALYATGIIYRADKVGELTGSWADLGSAKAKGRSFLLDDFQECIGAANLYDGFDLNTTDPAKLAKAKDWLVSLKPKIRGFSTDTIGNVTSGNAVIQHGWNGDTVNIRNQVKHPENVRFQKCKEGVPVGNDTFAIPANARHPGTALLFINFILEPEHAARNVEYFGYPMPYTGAAEEAFGKLVKDDPEIDVTLADVRRGKQFANLGAQGRRRWSDAWTEVKAA